MTSMIETLRQVIGQPDFMTTDGAINYGSMLEYVFCGLIVCIVISSVFKFLIKLVDR